MNGLGLPDPIDLSNAQLAEIEIDRHEFERDADYRRWVDSVLAELRRRALVYTHRTEARR
jgi:hypothetical protein